MLSLKSNCFDTKKQQAYSLIELIITIVATSLVMILFYSTFADNQLKSASPLLQTKASELGHAYLEEISLKRFDESSPIGNALRCNQTVALLCGNIGAEEGIGNRDLFDDVDDYNGVIDSPPKDALGLDHVGFNNFSVSVSVAYAGTDFGLSLQDLKKITVTVNSPDGGVFVFSQYRGNF